MGVDSEDSRQKRSSPDIGVCFVAFTMADFDTVLAPWADSLIQQMNINPSGLILLSFSGWRLAIFGLALVLVMRFRPEGLVPSRRLAAELHEAHP